MILGIMEQPTRRMNPLTLILSLSAAFFLLFVVISGAIYLSSRNGSGTSVSRKVGGGLFSGGSVAIVEVNGVIMDSKKTLKRLEALEDDDDVKAVVVRINSPGGAVAPSQEIYEALKRFKKPVVASMSSVAASGGYYVATAAKKIYANPGTITGSIGVIMEFANLEKLYEWARVKRYAIKTGKYKSIGAEYREMTAEERELLQAMVDDVLSQFKAAVSEGRKLPPARVTELADGRIFSGSQAKKAQLVDELGTLQDAINEAAKMAKITGKPNVVYSSPHRRSKLLDLVLDERGDDADSESSVGDLGALVRSLLGVGPSAGAAVDSVTSSFTPGIYWLWRGVH
jgi:protease-4